MQALLVATLTPLGLLALLDFSGTHVDPIGAFFSAAYLIAIFPITSRVSRLGIGPESILAGGVILSMTVSLFLGFTFGSFSGGIIAYVGSGLDLRELPIVELKPSAIELFFAFLIISAGTGLSFSVPRRATTTIFRQIGFVATLLFLLCTISVVGLSALVIYFEHRLGVIEFFEMMTVVFFAPILLFLFFSVRIFDWLIGTIFDGGNSRLLFGRITVLPLFSLRRRLEHWLEVDWEAGVANAGEMWCYTSQSSSVVSAIHAALGRMDSSVLLARVGRLAQNVFDWNVLLFGSASLSSALIQAGVNGIFLVPRKLRQEILARHPGDLRFDTPAQCACAGFWLWHDGRASEAAAAFAKVRGLPHGAELHDMAMAIAMGEGVESLGSFHTWAEATAWLDSLPPEPLRAATIATLRDLRAVALEAVTADQSHAPLNRVGALGRAAARLNAFISEDPRNLSEPEGPFLIEIAKRWLDIILKAGGAVGEAVVRQPTPNHYEGYSGLPALGHSFTGRTDILRRIETLWAASDTLPTIFLYGHRRMGKTSILRYLEAATPHDTLVIYLDMQDVGWVEETAELLRDFAEAIHRKALNAGLNAGEPPSEETYQTLDRARRSINNLLDHLDPQLTGRRLILAIDEFEFIEEGIQKGRLDPGVLPWLRSRVQRHRWLGIIFGGLHTLEEMGGDYQKAFFSQTENVRVTYLTRKDFDRLVTQPHPDFSLEYAQDLLDEIYRLTHGQPFLVQRLCWEFVTRWNERFLEQGETTPRILTLADLEPVLDSDFFKNAEYYFDGVWKNVTEEERQLMAFLATREKPWQKAELTAARLEDLADTLLRLGRHDVILENDGEIRFASELMRRWVALQGGGQLA